MGSYFIEFPGRPIPKKRPRMGIAGKKAWVINSQSSVEHEKEWTAWHQLLAQGLLKPLEGPIFIKMVSYDLFPKSWSKKRLKQSQEKGSWKSSRPDADNYIKFYLDVLNGIAYLDDGQICEIWNQKKYCDKPRVEITLQTRSL